MKKKGVIPRDVIPQRVMQKGVIPCYRRKGVIPQRVMQRRLSLYYQKVIMIYQQYPTH